tara:strand:+ start:3116 stop:3259 length:144 start_codon:yes stop_codon:yes gene_type:complete
MKGDLTFLDDLDNVLSKHYGEDWQWKFERLDGGFEIILMVDEDNEDE